jgi:hypothetical protein
MAGVLDETVAAIGGLDEGAARLLRDMATFDSAGVSGEKA